MGNYFNNDPLHNKRVHYNFIALEKARKEPFVAAISDTANSGGSFGILYLDRNCAGILFVISDTKFS